MKKGNYNMKPSDIEKIEDSKELVLPRLEDTPRDTMWKGNNKYSATLAENGVLVTKNDNQYVFLNMYEPQDCFFWVSKNSLVAYGHEEVAVVDVLNTKDYILAQTR